MFNRFDERLILVGFFLVCTFAACYPILLHPDRHLAEPPLGDKGTNLWNLWWVYYALFHLHQSPLDCHLIYYPWGCDLRAHTLSPLNGLLASPITAVWGSNVSYNLLFVISTFLTGLWAALWARELRLSLPAVCLFGLIAALGPYRWLHQIHLNLFSTQWMFLFFLGLERWLQSRQITGAVGCLIAWLCTFLTDWYYCLFISLYWALRMLFFFWSEREKMQIVRNLVFLSISVLVIGISVGGYLYTPLRPDRPKYSVDPVGIEYSSYWSLDGVQLLLPDWILSLFRIPVERQMEFNLHPGIVFFSLGIATILLKRKLRDSFPLVNFFIATSILFFVLSLGPLLKWWGQVVEYQGIPVLLPALAFEPIPRLTTIRVFARFASIGYLLLCLLALAGLQNCLAFIRIQTVKWVVYFIFGIVFLLEVRWFYPRMLEYDRNEEIYRNVTGPVLELPYKPSRLSGLHLFHQTFHHQPIYVTEISRLGQYRDRYMSSFPALERVQRYLQGDDESSRPEDPCLGLQQLGLQNLYVWLESADPNPIPSQLQRIDLFQKNCPAIQVFTVK